MFRSVRHSWILLLAATAGGCELAAQSNPPAVAPCADVHTLVGKLDYDEVNGENLTAAHKAHEELSRRCQTCAPELVKQLLNRPLRERGRDSLKRLVLEAGDAAVPPLLAGLDSSPYGWQMAVEMLPEFGPGAAPLIAAQFHSKSPAVRKGVVESLVKLGQPAVPTLIAALNDPLPEIRYRAASALGEIGPAGRHALEPLKQAMASDDLELVFRAAQTIGRVSPDRRDYLPGMQRLATSQDRHRLEAIEYLSGMLDDDETMAKLAKLARDDPEREVRRTVLKTFGSMGPSMVALMLDIFFESVGDKDEYVRDTAVDTLIQFGPQIAKDAVPRLTALMEQTKSRYVRQDAVKALSGMGAAAVPVLLKEGETEAMQEIGAPAVPALIELLKSGKEDSQQKAIWAIREMVPAETAPAMPEINRLASQKNKALRANAIVALRQYITAGQPGISIEALIDAAKDFEDDDAQSHALIALGELGPQAAPAIPTLLELARGKNQEMRYMAVDQLGHLGTAANNEVIDTLTNSLDDEYWRVRTFALMSLERLGPKIAARAAEPLEKLLKNSSLEHSDRHTAEDLLQAIREQNK